MGHCLSQTCFALLIFSFPIILQPSLHLPYLNAHHFIMLHLFSPLSLHYPHLFSPFLLSFLSIFQFPSFSLTSPFGSFNLFSPRCHLFILPRLPPSLSIHPSSSLAIFSLHPSLCVSASIRGKWKKWHQLFGKRRDMERERKRRQGCNRR